MSHLADMSWYAALVSIALAVLSRRTALDRLKYAAGAFLAFLLIAIAIGWLMLPFSR